MEKIRLLKTMLFDMHCQERHKLSYDLHLPSSKGGFVGG